MFSPVKRVRELFSRWRPLSNNTRQLIVATTLTAAFLAIGIGLLWLTKEILGIESDAVYLGLVLVPVVVFLGLTDKLQKFSIFGASAEFIKKLSDVESNVTETEPAKSTYFGKLRQVMDDKKTPFALIYGDVDKLRDLVSKTYREQKEAQEKDKSIIRRQTDRQIRDDIIQKLVFSMTDSFYDFIIGDGAKHDVFLLEQPDVLMIVRSGQANVARGIANEALKKFQSQGYQATLVVMSHPDPDKEKPQDLHKELVDLLSRRKDQGDRGKVHHY
jgi:hypothetical protein